MRRRAKRKTPTWSAGRPSADGFTLLELLVVLVVVALLAALALPSFPPGRDGVQVAARDVASALRLARNRALQSNRAVRFSLDVDDRGYTVDGVRHGILPPGMEIRLVAAETEQVSRSRGAIRFFPDGSATGGRITLAQDNRRREVDVDWLTGRVDLRE